jgi:hypothetical protein
MQPETDYELEPAMAEQLYPTNDNSSLQDNIEEEAYELEKKNPLIPREPKLPTI